MRVSTNPTIFIVTKAHYCVYCSIIRILYTVICSNHHFLEYIFLPRLSEKVIWVSLILYIHIIYWCWQKKIGFLYPVDCDLYLRWLLHSKPKDVFDLNCPNELRVTPTGYFLYVWCFFQPSLYIMTLRGIAVRSLGQFTSKTSFDLSCIYMHW
jgi:hypothetical protein